MSCRICGRYACTESFHSIEAQEEFERKQTEKPDKESKEGYTKLNLEE